MNVKKLAIIAAASLWTAGSVQAATQLLQFEPNPISPTVPEFSWTGPGGNFVDSAGSHNALQIDTPLTVNAVNPVAADETTSVNNGSQFQDATLVLSSSTVPTDLADNGAGIIGSEAFQGLTDGFFTISAADGEILLTGRLQENYLQIPVGSSASGYEGGDVTYTGGLIFNALIASGGSAIGSASISMTTVNGSDIGVTSSGDTAQIAAFTANANGVFDVVPEPASLGLIAVGTILTARRRRV